MSRRIMLREGQREVTRGCPVCGTWECGTCGWTRVYANRFSAEPQQCANPYCRSVDRTAGRMLPTGHAGYRAEAHQREYLRLLDQGRTPRYPLEPLPPRRPDWDEYFLDIADAVSARGECVRSQVAAVLVRDRRIVATGYNGVEPGAQSCLDGICPRERLGAPRGTLYSEAPCIATHAEDNAIRDAYARGLDVPGCTVYVTKEPCEDCAGLLRGLQLRVVWRDRSRGTAGTTDWRTTESVV